MVFTTRTRLKHRSSPHSALRRSFARLRRSDFHNFDQRKSKMNHTILSQPLLIPALVVGIGFALGSALAMSNVAMDDLTSFGPAPVVPLTSQPLAHLIVDSPLPEQLARGYVVVRYRAENVRIMPVYGPAALAILPRIGHLHITVDDLPWHWLDASGEPISINGLPPGPHHLLIELEDPTHKVLDSATVHFEIPKHV
jgi:hypothetical protein